MLRQVKYDEAAAQELLYLLEAGKKQHVEVLFRRAERLMDSAELQSGVRKIHEHPPLYELLLAAEEFDEVLPPAQYRIVFTLSNQDVLMVRFQFLEEGE